MLLYDLVVRSYGLAIRAASVRNQKASQWLRGRRQWREKLRKQREKLHSGEVIWVHCASYGEFEQGRPLIEGLRKKYPSCAILLSFFSPSGYEPFSDWAGADIVCYLPLDTKANARDFVNIVKPRMVVFIKYEFWLNYLNELKRQNVLTYLVSAVFKPHHPFFRWYGTVFRRSLQSFRHMFIQDENSARLLGKIGFTNFTVCGDTRFDRVIEIKEKFSPIREVAEFKGDRKMIIAGSTWPKDEALLLEAWKLFSDGGAKLLIAPHEINEKSVAQLTTRLDKLQLTYSRFSNGADARVDILILDTMGMLARSYGHAEAAYIGGGLDTGIHNILEPVVYGIPVSFAGTDHQKFNEAVNLIQAGVASIVNSPGELVDVWKKQLGDLPYREKTAAVLQSYFQRNSQSTASILREIRMEV
jgi:3-deoxy-D-manno-octulosonic-acid transferase